MPRGFVNSPGVGLKRLREGRGIYAKDLAETAGISASYLSEIETGRRSLTESIAEKIAGALGLTPPQLLAEVDRLTKAGIGPAPRPIREAAPPAYRAAGFSDAEELAMYFLRTLDRAEVFSLLGRFTEAGSQGDASALASARALLDLVTQTHPTP